MARQRDAALASLDQFQRDARRDQDGALASRTLIDAAVQSQTRARQQTDDAIVREQQTRSSLADAIRQRDESRQQLTTLRAHITHYTAATASRIQSLHASIIASETQISALRATLDQHKLDQAAALVALAEAQLDLDLPASAREHADAALLVLDAIESHDRSAPLALRAQQARVRALVELPPPTAQDAADTRVLASNLLDRIDATAGPDSDERWQIASLLGQATLAAGDPGSAAVMLTEVLAVQMDREGLASASTRRTQVRLAEALIALGRTAEGAALLQLVLKAERDSTGSSIARRAQAALKAFQTPADDRDPDTRLASQSSDDTPE